jgi:type IV secretory pathway VirB2 component (pilin)
VDANEGVEQLAGITNLVISFAGPIAVLMLIAGAIMYATAGGEEENMKKAKRLILVTVVGIIIIYGAFAIVSTILSSSLTEIGTIVE